MSDLPTGSNSGANQQTYERLKASLSLSLRRQIFIGVCDDLRLRDRLAMQLQAELSDHVSISGSSHNLPRLVTLDLDLQDPNPIAQVSNWLSDWLSQVSTRSRRVTAPAFQILGIERLTRQSAADQNLFLSYLQEIEQYLPVIESGLLLWMTQPWFRMLPEAAPEFWQYHTGIFEFAGDPTPLLITSPERIQLDFSAASSRDLWSRDLPGGNTSAPLVLPPTNPWLALADDLSDDLNIWYEPEDPGALAKRISQRPVELPELGDWITEFNGLDTSWLEPPMPQSGGELSQTYEPTQSLATLAPPALPSLPGLDELEDADLIEHIGSLQQQLAMLQAGQESPLMLATAYRTLGNFYRDCIEQGDVTVENLAMAIQAYEQSLQCQPNSQPDSQLAELLNDLGNLYWSLAQIQTEDAAICLQRTLQLYQLALSGLEPQQLETYAMLQNNLGGVYADLAHYQEPVLNLEQSVQAYQQALQCRTIAADPIRYASTQNNLGTTYWNLAQHQQPNLNLKQAILAYAEALNHYSSAQDPLHYAMIQNNLGTAYWNLAQYRLSPDSPDSKDYLMLAVLAYQSALQYRTLESHPAGFAATQNNLGTAHWHLAHQAQGAERRSYLEQAISDYETTLAAAADLSHDQPDARLGFDLVSTQNNLGLAHYQLAIDPQVGAALASHLKSALHCHLLALQSWENQLELRPTAINCIVQTVRAFYSELGLTGQNQALALLPSQLLAEILPKL